jgi:hypothetical protein
VLECDGKSVAEKNKGSKSAEIKLILENTVGGMFDIYAAFIYVFFLVRMYSIGNDQCIWDCATDEFRKFNSRFNNDSGPIRTAV